MVISYQALYDIAQGISLAALIFLAVIGLANITEYIVLKVISVPVQKETMDCEVIVHLRDVEKAEAQLRSMLGSARWQGYCGKLSFVCHNEECMQIASKFLAKYPNIGLFSSEDLNYNIKE